MAKAWASQGARKTGPPSSRGRPGSSAGVEVVIPEIDVDVVVGRGGRSPELPPAEAHAVDVLWLLALAERVGVGKDEDAVVPIHHALTAADVAGQARVAE